MHHIDVGNILEDISNLYLLLYLPLLTHFGFHQENMLSVHTSSCTLACYNFVQKNFFSTQPFPKILPQEVLTLHISCVHLRQAALFKSDDQFYMSVLEILKIRWICHLYFRNMYLILFLMTRSPVVGSFKLVLH